MQQFRVDLKTSLGLAMPNQYSQTVRKQISSWFRGDNYCTIWYCECNFLQHLYTHLHKQLCMHTVTKHTTYQSELVHFHKQIFYHFISYCTGILTCRGAKLAYIQYWHVSSYKRSSRKLWRENFRQIAS